MKYISALFEGYIGFYNGMGLNSLFLDFTKCKNKIVVIRGSNGVGKSTLLNALNLFPDPSNSFIPNMDGSKIFKIESNGDIYDIRILSPVDTSGNRKNKCFISKNGVEMNDNGNVTSYKEILFTEFDLDSNFISLTRLSSTNKGLGLLTPAERKRFVSSIIDNLEVYNDMYKSLNKKSTIFKSQVNNLHTKIQNIGSRDSLETRLYSVQSKCKDLNQKIIDNNNAIIALQAKYSFNDEEVNEIKRLNDILSDLNNQLSVMDSNINSLSNRLHISRNDIEKEYERDSELIKEYEVNLEKYKSEYNTLLSNYNSNKESIDSLEASLFSYSSNIDESLESSYNKSKTTIENCESIIKSLGYTPDTTLLSPLIILLNFFKDLVSYIDSLYDDCSPEELDYICTRYDVSRMHTLQTELQNVILDIDSMEKKLSSTRDDIKKVSVLDNRPKKCNINDCPFIKEAFKIKSKSGDKIFSNLDEYQNTQFKLSEKLNSINMEIEKCNHSDMKKASLDKILREIEKYSEYLSIFKIDILLDRNKFLGLISKMNQFNFIREPQVLIDLRNQLSIYESEKSIFDRLTVSYNAQRDKIELINSNNALLDKLKADKESILENMKNAKLNLDKYQQLKDSFSGKVDKEKELLDLVKSFNALLDTKKPIELKLIEYNKKSSQLSSVLSDIDNYKANIDSYNAELKPLNEESNRISGQLLMLDSFYAEYNESKAKYDMIETLKKYCSPTGMGIQVLFIQLYMAKTLQLSNQILSMLFNNEYKLLDFVINNNEFRIPFIGNGLPVDDISSGSESQICMMSMILNLVLLHQASSKFNICRLDEIDAPLDRYNRAGFVSVLYQIIQILNIEQLFIISHNTELDASIADVIKLKYTNSYEDAESNTDMSNVIFDYSKM